MEDIINYNETRIEETKKEIKNCHGDYVIIGIDVDGVIYNSDPYMQEIIAKIDFEATKKYLALIANEETADYDEARKKSKAKFNAILEEKPYIEELENGKTKIINYPKIDYEEVYSDEHLIRYEDENGNTTAFAFEFVNYMLLNRPKNVFYIFVTHRNPDQEALVKIRNLYRLCPNINCILTPPYHSKKAKNMTNKAKFTEEMLKLDLDRFILIDDVKQNCKDVRDAGGTDIRLLPEGFDETHKLSDHLSKIASLDPYYIQFVLSFINYARKHKDYSDEVDERDKIRRLTK